MTSGSPSRANPRALALACLLPLLGACQGFPPGHSAVHHDGVAASTGIPATSPGAPGESDAARFSSRTGNARRQLVTGAGDAPRPDDLGSRLRRQFEKARALVESDTGTDLSNIELRLVDDERIFGEVRRETRRLVAGQLGEKPLGKRLLRALLEGQRGGYAALYAGERRAVLVSREVLLDYLASLPAGLERGDTALLVLMLHELVHAADDLRYAIHADRALDFRASFAQSALFEGHAQWRTRRLCERHGCLDGLDSLDAFMFGTRSEGRDAEQNLLEYAYVEGERFVAALAGRPDGTSLIARALASPPRDPLQILDPASFPNEAREARNRRLIDAARRVGHPWSDEGEGARVAVTTSPLKGVDLRGDPPRREAAVDGFTRLITAMVAVQFHDPAAATISPVEVTLMQTDSVGTARLFADTLHAHAAGTPAHGTEEDDGGGDRLLRHSATTLPEGDVWRTVIATRGTFVVQANGRGAGAKAMGDYVLGALDVLLGPDTAEPRASGAEAPAVSSS